MAMHHHRVCELHLAGEDRYVHLRANQQAWKALEELTGRSATAYVCDAADRRVTRVSELAWALSATWREDNLPGLEWNDFLRQLPANVIDEGWVKLRDHCRDLVSLSFFGQSWDSWWISLQEVIKQLDQPSQNPSPSTGSEDSTSP